MKLSTFKKTSIRKLLMNPCVLLMLVCGNFHAICQEQKSGLKVNAGITTHSKESILESTNVSHGSQRHGVPKIENGKIVPKKYVIQKSQKHVEKYDSIYRITRSELLRMKQSPEHFSLKKAVFAIENAFLENRMDYTSFENSIMDYIDFILTAIDEAGLDPDKESSRQYMLFKFMSDTLKVKSPYSEGILTHYPFQYDFEDFRAEYDFTKQFVTKLMSDGSGQCHSLPLLYLILAEELDIEAYLALAPNHSYIKIKDERGEFYNLELTRGQFVSDGFMMGSGYITSTALQNNIYMDTLSKSQLILQLFNDLNEGYLKKFGWDDYAISQIETILKEDPNNVIALMNKSNGILQTMRHEAESRGYPDIKTFTENDEYGKYLDHLWQRQHQKLVQLGHQDMPKEAYNAWLQSVEEKAEEQKKDIKMNNIQKF
ncbi:hypothetical protein N7E81_07180 [Reichenbachiella carrageenanivorans]|uniref:Protein SirB1 N-terminal domain-containing protein n=1 Tax=Reichenbachiella carrageenanivorans TaxID=2979869 RepID=A0ABY6D3Z4_9BACT|nr:hypothetical protein [Reichenbachiella carrageenanivorans]UXX80881.1 hypothetical protein N7E81_07180 [Reichenbachiella carrageenanivorans]